jgi:hypothetical protein
MLPDNIAPGWQGLALAPSGGPVTRRGYHCRGQPGLAHGKPAVIGRQNRPLLPGEFATPERHKNVPLKSGTTSSNPVPSSEESDANLIFRRVFAAFRGAGLVRPERLERALTENRGGRAGIEITPP